LTVEIEIAGRGRTVSVEPAGAGRYRVLIDGHPHLVDAVRVGEFSLSLIVDGQPPVSADRGSDSRTGCDPGTDPSPNPRTDRGSDPATPRVTREIHIAPGTARGETLVGIDGRTVAVTVNGRRSRRVAEGGSQAHGVQAVTAPMPGRIVRVLVQPGDRIAARQGVIVVEAMKMENELRSPKAGKVKEVTVSPGTSVEAGRILVVIE
jgi:biotin carboxyl carrier protein